jgi:hypothetical protein
MVLNIDNKPNMKDANFYFLEDLKGVYSKHGDSHVELEVLPISASQADTKAYCFRSADNLIIYMRSHQTFLGSKYARMSNEVYKNYFSAETTLFNSNPFTNMCRDQCTVDQLNYHRNLTHQVVLIKSEAEITRNHNMPIWVIEKPSDMITFNIESCFE